MCTDFDYVTEKVDIITLGAQIVRGNLGPWPDIPCYGSFQTTVNILSQHDVTALAKEGSIPVQVRASKDVDLNPCHGDTVVVRMALTLVSAEPIVEEQQSLWLSGPLSISFGSSIDLNELSIIKYGRGLLLHFASLTKLQNTSVFWMTVVVGHPAVLRIEREPGNSTGGVALSVQPTIEVLDLGGTHVKITSVSVRASLILDNISFIQPVIVSSVVCPEKCTSACRRQIALGVYQNCTTLPEPRLSGASEVRVSSGRATFTDLSVDVAAHGYRLHFHLAPSQHVGPVTSSAFTIFRGRPDSLSIKVQPTSWSFGGKVFSRQPLLLALDAGGNVARAVDFLLTASIAVNAAVSGRLHGQHTVAASLSDEGYLVAIFTDLSIGESHARAFALRI